MGCGAVCGNSSSVTQISKQAEMQFMNLFQQITPNKFLYPIKSIINFTKEMKLYPNRLNLILTQKLQAKSIIPVGVMEKWKIILFGLDTDYVTYLNCLGYPQNVQKAKPITDKPTNDQNSNEMSVAGQHMTQNTELLQHKVFAQIEKDIERTFPGYDFEKKSFAAILKKIANHFPIMGYTQGINFIVGYLLIIGYSEFDTFWLFVHMALNRRYLLLGLYEDGFPLINVYISIFRNMLKRINNKLYKHLYEKVEMFDESAWVFKWFMTCYLSSFPLEMCQFVWDLVLCTGGIGLIKFAISLVTKLEKELLKQEEACDLTDFFSSLKEVQTFNSYLSIRQIVKGTYTIKIQFQDLKDLQQIKTQRGGKNFYARYFLVKFKQDYEDKIKTPVSQENQINKTNNMFMTDPILFKRIIHKQSNDLLDNWYEKLIQQRKQFKLEAQNRVRKKSKTNMLGAIQQEISIQLASNHKEPETVQVIELPTQPKIQRKGRPSIEHFDCLEGMMMEIQMKKEQKIERLESVPTSPKNKSIVLTNSNRYARKKSKEMAVWDSGDDQQAQNQEKKDTIQIEDQLFYISKDIRLKRKNVQQEPSDILSQFSNPTTIKQNRGMQRVRPNIAKADSVIDINVNTQRSRLARVGNSVLSSMSASNASGKSSNSSHRTIQKQNSIGIGRACKCIKNKTEQNGTETMSATRKQIRTSKKGEEGQNHQQSMDNIPNLRKRQRLNTSHEWMANSQGPIQLVKNMVVSNIKHPSQIGSEVQIHNVRMFKKKNKANRIDQFGIVHHCQNRIQQQISECQSRHEPIHAQGYQQQSCESFFIGNTSQHKSQICEIESVK